MHVFDLGNRNISIFHRRRLHTRCSSWVARLSWRFSRKPTEGKMMGNSWAEKFTPSGFPVHRIKIDYHPPNWVWKMWLYFVVRDNYSLWFTLIKTDLATVRATNVRLTRTRALMTRCEPNHRICIRTSYSFIPSQNIAIFWQVERGWSDGVRSEEVILNVTCKKVFVSDWSIVCFRSFVVLWSAKKVA